LSRITINSNAASLNAQRHLRSTTGSLQQSFERLSSGLRINRASDDAAGLAIASLLSTDSRVYTQGIRNVNDGIGLLNIAEGSLSQLSNITQRLNELAEQSANGIYGASQRRAMQIEANSLTDEFNRIIGTTSFNGLNLIDNSLSSLQIQAGFGNAAQGGSLRLGIGSELDRAVGNGRFSLAGTINYSGFFFFGNWPTAVADITGDGILDILTADGNGVNGALSVNRGNGDGTFTQLAGFSISGGSPSSIATGDFDGDGRTDVAIRDSSTNSVEFAWGDGAGGFSGSSFVNLGFGGGTLATGDFNGDGKTDVAVNTTGGGIRLARTTTGRTLTQSQIVNVNANAVAGGDLNGDGRTDLAYTTNAGVSVMLGTGGGAFASATTYSTGTTTNNFLQIADVNVDGFADLLVGLGANGVASFRGQGNGTLGSANVTASSAGSSYDTPLVTGDANNDGFLDILVSGEFMYGAADGRFRAAITNPTADYNPAGAGDFNRDGVLDLLGNLYDESGGTIHLGASTNVTTIARQDITTATNARSALTTFRAILSRITSELGSVGASQSRLGVAASNLLQGRENFDSARSRITDVDVSDESSKLVRSSILQRAGAAILAQANQQPSLVLRLLS